jgi:hypothetical protein
MGKRKRMRIKRELWDKLVLVIGHRRSGATWFGNMLATVKEVQYLDEPDAPASIFRAASLPDQFGFAWGLKSMLSRPRDEYWDWLAPKFLDYTRWLVASELKTEHDHPIRTLVIKFASPWLADKYAELYQPDHLIYVKRHPLGIYNSYTKLNWDAVFRLEYAQLYIHEGRNPTLQAIRHPVERMLAMIYIRDTQMKSLVKQYDGFVADYDELCARPWPNYIRIFESLGMEMSQGARTRMMDMLLPEVEETGMRDVKKNSLKRSIAWRHELLPQTIDAARAFVERNRLPFVID